MEREEKHPLIASLAERRERHLQRGRFYRIMFAIAGGTVTLAGLVMFVTPGPALIVIPIGLAMLALEFVWAEQLLERAVERAEAAKKSAVEASRAQRVFGALATVAAIAAAVVAAVLWDIPLVPV